MRKPFLLVLILLSLWVWSLDFIDVLFYYFRFHYTAISGTLSALTIFSILCYFFTRLYCKVLNLELLDLRPGKESLREFGLLILFFLPILYLNYQRIMYPDIDYDVQAYHIVLHKLNRLDNLNNFNLVGSSGGGTYFFTLSYKVFGLFREIFGFRVGTILNTFLLFVIFLSVYDFLKCFLRRFYPEQGVTSFWISAAAFFAIFADNALFNLNSYKVDVMGVPLLLELTHLLFFRPIQRESKVRDLIFFSLIASIAIAYKLTFLPYACLLGLAYVWRNRKLLLENKRAVLYFSFVLFFPSIYMLYSYTETSNPIFPFYNKLFKSPLYPPQNFKDVRWGPRNLVEMLYYNISCFRNPERNNEWKMFSMRLLVEYVCILTGIVMALYYKFRKREQSIKFLLGLIFLAVACNYTLMYTTGIYRYGVFIEVLFGIVMLLLLYRVFFEKQWILFALTLVISYGQVRVTYGHIYQDEMNLSWYHYKELRNLDSGQIHATQKSLLFRDYDSGIDSVIKNLQIVAFLSGNMDGFIKLLAPDKPIYNLNSFGERQKIADQFRVNKVDTMSSQGHFYAITDKFNLLETVNNLNSRNFYVQDVFDVYPKFVVSNYPIYLLRIKSYNRAQYKITNVKSMLRVDSSGVSPRFDYSADHPFRTFIIEDPFTYNWSGRPDSSNFSVNNYSYHQFIKGDKNKIVTIPETTGIRFLNKNPVHYFIIVQELQHVEGPITH